MWTCARTLNGAWQRTPRSGCAVPLNWTGCWAIAAIRWLGRLPSPRRDDARIGSGADVALLDIDLGGERSFGLPAGCNKGLSHWRSRRRTDLHELRVILFIAAPYANGALSHG